MPLPRAPFPPAPSLSPAVPDYVPDDLLDGDGDTDCFPWT
jgi:hypothetical protein